MQSSGEETAGVTVARVTVLLRQISLSHTKKEMR